MEKLLKDFKVGESGVVKAIFADGLLKRRIFDMGLTPGAKIEVKKYAPLGDPIEIMVRGYNLSLRKSEAESVLMEI